MSVIEQAWGTRTALTITLASLASDANFLAGRESSSFDLTAVDCVDLMLDGKVTTGTSPTDAREIRVYVVASMDGTTWPDVFDGTDSAETVTSAGVRDGCCVIAAAMATNNTSDRAYFFGPVSVRDLFGSLPRRIVVFVTHSTGVNLNGTAGNHEVAATPVHYTSA